MIALKQGIKLITNMTEIEINWRHGRHLESARETPSIDVYLIEEQPCKISFPSDLKRRSLKLEQHRPNKNKTSSDSSWSNSPGTVCKLCLMGISSQSTDERKPPGRRIASFLAACDMASAARATAAAGGVDEEWRCWRQNTRTHTHLLNANHWMDTQSLTDGRTDLCEQRLTDNTWRHQPGHFDSLTL